MQKKESVELLATMDGLREAYRQPGTGPGAFREGHPRVGGRKPGSKNKRTAAAWELVEKLENELGRPCNPMEALLRTSVDESVPLDVRIDCAKSLLPFLFPRLQANSTQIVGDPDAPAEHRFNIDVLLADPVLLEAAQRLALAMAGHQEPLPELPEGEQE